MTRVLPHLHGHVDVRNALARSALRGDLAPSLLIHGAPGIGKQRLALWLAQLLLCAQPSQDGPCDACQHCRLVLRLEHPDLHWFFPLVRPKGASADRLADALEEARAEEIEARREQPLRAPAPGEPTGIFLAQVQTLRRLAVARPAMATRKVFIVGGAEKLVPQESSPEAANALLKLLEEPPSDTTIILTASDPEALLPTIRSRLLPVRLRALPIDAVAAFLQESIDLPAADAQFRARIAEGSIGRALGYIGDDEHPGPLEELRLQARAALQAALDDDDAARLQLALTQAPAGARGAFSDMLEQLARWIRDLVAAASGADDLVVNVDALDWLRAHAHDALPGRRGALAIAAIEQAMDLAQGNVNPQLVLADLLRTLRELLAAPSRAGRHETV